MLALIEGQLLRKLSSSPRMPHVNHRHNIIISPHTEEVTAIHLRRKRSSNHVVSLASIECFPSFLFLCLGTQVHLQCEKKLEKKNKIKESRKAAQLGIDGNVEDLK